MVTEEFCVELQSSLHEFDLFFHVNYIVVALNLNA